MSPYVCCLSFPTSELTFYLLLLLITQCWLRQQLELRKNLEKISQSMNRLFISNSSYQKFIKILVVDNKGFLAISGMSDTLWAAVLLCDVPLVFTEKNLRCFQTGNENIQRQVFISMFITLSRDQRWMKTYKASEEKNKTYTHTHTHTHTHTCASHFFPMKWKAQLLLLSRCWISFLTPDHFSLYHFQNTYQRK